MMTSYKIIHYNMNTISVPLPRDLEKFIADYIKSGEAENKAQVVRKALRKLSEGDAYARILQAEAEIAAGKVHRGNLKTLLKKI